MSQKKDKSKILFFRESSFRVAELIFNYPNKTFHIRGIAEDTELSTTAVTSAVQELANFKIISLEKTKITTEIKAYLDSEVYTFYKKVFNLYRLERYGLIQTLKDVLKAKTIVLFGSFAKGEDIEESDVDLLVITNNNEDLSSYITEWEKELNRKINLHILPNLNKSSPEFKNALANGIVLHGYLKVV